MAKNQVTLTFAGDSSSLERTFDRVGAGARGMSDDVTASGAGFDRLGESADTVDTRMMGLSDGIQGVGDLMRGDLAPHEYAMALSDIGSSIYNFVAPSLKQLWTSITTTGRAAVTAAAQHVAAAARTVAGWVLMGVQAMVNAAKIAAAWLISLGPVGLVIAAVAAVIAILVALGVGFDDLKRWALAAWDFILGAVKAVWSWVSENWPLLLAILTGPIGLAVLFITRHWDTIKAGFSAVVSWIAAGIGKVVSFFTGMPRRLANAAGDLFGFIIGNFKGALNSVIGLWNGLSFPEFTIGGWDPPGPGPTIPSMTVGGWSLPDIPYFHGGGTFRAPPGQREGLAMLLDGERVTRPGQASGGPTIQVYVQGSVLSDRDLAERLRDLLDTGHFRGALA